MRETFRLNQFLARCGVASRRKADDLILSGKVTINDRKADHPGIRIRPGKDVVRVGGRAVSLPSTVTLILHKPKGVLCSRHDPEGRRTIYELIPSRFRRVGVQSIGRLDFDSSGLIILTNDGDLHQAMEHPSGGVIREYQVKARGICTPSIREKLLAGVILEEGPAHAESVEVLKISGGISRFSLTLTEGRNREVRRLCERIGLVVLDLKRIRFGKITLGRLPSGKWREPLSWERVFFERLKKRSRAGEKTNKAD